MENNQDVIELAKKELEAVCDKYNVTLIPVIVHQGNRTASSIEIVTIQEPNTAASKIEKAE